MSSSSASSSYSSLGSCFTLAFRAVLDFLFSSLILVLLRLGFLVGGTDDDDDGVVARLAAARVEEGGGLEVVAGMES